MIIALVLVGGISAQTPQDGLRSKVRAIHYQPLAEQARIQGDVHLDINSGVVTLLSGHPLLAPTAVESAKAFGSIYGETNLSVTYHFVLLANTAMSVPISTTVPIGNAFERGVLRTFGLKTEKTVIVSVCQNGLPPRSDFKIAGAAIEIWVYGRSFCIETEAATF